MGRSGKLGEQGNDDSTSADSAMIRRLLGEAGELALREHDLTPEVAEAFSGYSLISRIGKGGMGATVFLARREMDGEKFAIKVLPAELAKDDDLSRRFDREILTMQSIQHRNLVSILEAGSSDLGHRFIIMEYVPGGSLSDRIAEGIHIETTDAVKLIADCAAGVEQMHKDGIVHRDLKPGNIFLDKRKQPKVGDFGLVRNPNGSSPLTRAGAAIGTIGYMSPEQLKGSSSVGPQADVYGLATILYQLLTGAMPGANAPVPSSFRKDAAVFDDVIMKALETDPSRRFESAGEFGQALLGAPVTERRHLTRRVVIGSMALSTIGLAGWGVMQQAGSQSGFWERIREAQRSLDGPGDYPVSLLVDSDIVVSFLLTLSAASASYRMAEVSAPPAFLTPLPVEDLERIIRESVAPGLMGRIAVKRLTISGAPSEVTGQQAYQLSNAPDGTREERMRFRDSVSLIEVLSDKGLLPSSLLLSPSQCPDFAGYCRQLGVEWETVFRLKQDSGMRKAVIRTLGYELLRDPAAKSHPLFERKPKVEITTRTMIEVIAALIADKWLCQRSGLKDEAALWDADGAELERNRKVEKVVTDLLAGT